MVKFTYLDVEYELEDLVGKDNLYQLPHGNKFGIKRSGITELQHKFPDIKVELGEVSVAEFNGQSVLVLNAKAYDARGMGPTINTLAEVSEENMSSDREEVTADRLKWPVSTLEHRAKHRCFLEMLNLHGKVYSEDELSSVAGLAKKVDTKPKESLKKEEAKITNINPMTNPEFVRVTQEIRETCYILKKSDDERRKIYARGVGLPETSTIDEIMKKLDLDVAKRILHELKNSK